MKYAKTPTTEEWRAYYTLFGRPLVFGVEVDGEQVDLRKALYLEEGELRLDTDRAMELYREYEAERYLVDHGPRGAS